MTIAGEVPNHLSLPADLNCLAEARAWSRSHAHRLGFAGRELVEVELAVTEAVSNVIRHGYQQDATQAVELEVEPADDALVLVVRDRGPAYDPTDRPLVDLSEPRAGGYGVHLISTVMDEVTWKRRPDGWNELRLVRRRPTGPDR